jgi:hypothetical protein
MATNYVKMGADQTLDTSYILNILPYVMDNVQHNIRITQELSISRI